MEKKSIKIKRWITGIAVTLLLAAIFTIVFSPYGKEQDYPFRIVGHTVVIDASVERTYAFLGNSGNATRWSVYVNHINTLNADTVADGAVGSRRRCFCYSDEKGRQWDELITEVIPNKKRQLIIYNLKDFPLTADNLATEQIYEPMGANKCKLTFIVFYKDITPSLTDKAKMYFSAYDIKRVFKANMANIKRLVEEERARGI